MEKAGTSIVFIVENLNNFIENESYVHTTITMRKCLKLYNVPKLIMKFSEFENITNYPCVIVYILYTMILLKRHSRELDLRGAVNFAKILFSCIHIAN
jgi:hypothetical protein